jgi:uncharacterized protein (TIGR00730 family)
MKICVFCSSSEAVDGLYVRDARELGRLIATGGHSLIYGGGGYGLMGAVARAVRANGGEVTGVIPAFMAERKLAEADRIIVTRDMRERKARMEELSDAFIALPGGFGTLEEILEIITLCQLGAVIKPVAFVNTAGFYDPLLAVFEKLYTESFAKPAFRVLYSVAAGPREALSDILTWTPGERVSKWM